MPRSVIVITGRPIKTFNMIDEQSYKNVGVHFHVLCEGCRQSYRTSYLSTRLQFEHFLSANFKKKTNFLTKTGFFW